MSSTQQQNPCTITIGKVRFSYLALWEAKAIEEGQTPKYSVSAIIPKTDTATVAKINAAIEAAKLQGKDSKFGGKVPPVLKTPLRDGDAERPDDEAYKGCYFINCHATTRPGAVDANRAPIMNQDDIYSGAYGYVNITLYPYNTAGSRGIAAGFNHIMKTDDGERLSGRVSIDDAFGDIQIHPDAAGLM